MKKRLLIIIPIVIAAVAFFFVYRYYNKEDKTTTLTVNEKRWVEKNKDQAYDFEVVNDYPLYGLNGEGVIFDFLDDFEKKIGVTFNRIPYLKSSEPTGEAFKIRILSNDEKLTKNDLFLFNDNYVAVGKEYRRINHIDDMKNIKFGVFEKDSEEIGFYLKSGTNLSYKTYNSIEDLYKGLDAGEINMIIVPNIMYLDYTIQKDKYHINYYFTEMKKQIVLTLSKDEKETVPKSDTVEKTDDTNRSEPEKGEQILKITLIEPNKSQPRKDFDIEALKELSESIKQFGLLQPILVRKKDDKYYEIIAGERRWRAAKLAGLKEVPVIIRDFTTEQVMEAALIENIQRKDLNPIEEALAFSNLINEYTLTQEELAAKVSKSRAQISNTMRLLKLNANVQQMLIADEISMGHARAILAINDEEIQMEVAKYVINNDLSVRETEKYIKDILEPRQTVQKPAALNPAGLLVYRDMEKKMSNCLGSKVGIKTRDGKKGRIEIEYSSQEELERLFDKLSI